MGVIAICVGAGLRFFLFSGVRNPLVFGEKPSTRRSGLEGRGVWRRLDVGTGKKNEKLEEKMICEKKFNEFLPEKFREGSRVWGGIVKEVGVGERWELWDGVAAREGFVLGGDEWVMEGGEGVKTREGEK